jgi:hypothetical protein
MSFDVLLFIDPADIFGQGVESAPCPVVQHAISLLLYHSTVRWCGLETRYATLGLPFAQPEVGVCPECAQQLVICISDCEAFTRSSLTAPAETDMGLQSVPGIVHRNFTMLCP